MPANYEWDVETVDEYGDIQDHHHADKLEELWKPKEPDELVLVRDVWTEDKGLIDRQWAYVENDRLPFEFDGGARVPKRFHREFDKWMRASS